MEAKAIRSQAKQVLSDMQGANSQQEALHSKASPIQQDSLQTAAAATTPQQELLDMKGTASQQQVHSGGPVPQQEPFHTITDKSQEVLQAATHSEQQLLHVVTSKSQQCVLQAVDSADSSTLQLCLTPMH
eukprot:scaffold191709_cov19-Tisochrysis_lutea.AAC.1